MESINHYGLVRLRVQGTGNLKLKLLSLPNRSGDAVAEQILTSLVMSETNQFKDTLANFNQMSAQLEIKTTEIDEVFELNKIIIYSVPVSASYPV